jgi:predicted protein tyrosine phosphatase
MDVIFTPELTVCGIEELPGQRTRNVTHVLSLIDPEYPELDAFQTYGKHQRTTLRFHDIIAEAPGRVMPHPDHVAEILRFGTDCQSGRMQMAQAICSSIAIWACRARRPPCCH